MVIKHKKKWSILLVIKGNASIDHSEKACNVHSVGKGVRRLMILCVGKDGNSMAILIHCWWEKIYHYLVKVTIYMDYYLQFHSWILSIESLTHTHIHTHQETCTWVGFCFITKCRTQPQFLSIKEKINSGIFTQMVHHTAINDYSRQCGWILEMPCEVKASGRRLWTLYSSS